MVANEKWFTGASASSGLYDFQIEQSCRFDKDTPSYLRLSEGSGNNDYWTFSFWFKTHALDSGTSQEFLSAGNGGSSSSDTLLRIGLMDQSNGSFIRVNSGATNIIDTTAKFQDPTAWTHLVWNNNNGSTVLYINGTQVGSGTLDGGSGSVINNTGCAHYIGRGRNADSNHVDGYLAEMMMISASGSAGVLTPSSFAENHRGVWRPLDISGLSNQDFYLKFENASDLGNDSSSNNRDWTPTGLGSDHQTKDTITFGS
tara:strand:+ start:138 stop:908 length:771 start_codon:yes stop_codon:yes gene_type:complete